MSRALVVSILLAGVAAAQPPAAAPALAPVLRLEAAMPAPHAGFLYSPRAHSQTGAAIKALDAMVIGLRGEVTRVVDERDDVLERIHRLHMSRIATEAPDVSPAVAWVFVGGLAGAWPLGLRELAGTSGWATVGASVASVAVVALTAWAVE